MAKNPAPKGTTKQDATRRNSRTCFTAISPPRRRTSMCGGHHRNPTDEGNALLATVLTVLAQAAGLPPSRTRRRTRVRRDQDRTSIRAAAPRSRRRKSHRSRDRPATANTFHGYVGVSACPVDGPGRIDNAAAEAFFSTLEHEVLVPAPLHHPRPGPQVYRRLVARISKTRRRHSSAGLQAPDHYRKNHRRTVGAA